MTSTLESFLKSGLPIEAVEPRGEFVYQKLELAPRLTNFAIEISLNPNLVRRKLYWAIWSNVTPAGLVIQSEVQVLFKGSTLIRIPHYSNATINDLKLSNQQTETASASAIVVDDEGFIINGAAGVYGVTPIRFLATADLVRFLLINVRLSDIRKQLSGFLGCYSEAWIGREYRH